MHEKLYAQILRLYPRDYRADFAAEMASVFRDALADAQRSGSRGVLRLWIRELKSLPAIVLGTLARRDRGHGPLHILLAVVLLFVAGALTSELVATRGLYQLFSLAILCAGLAAGGFAYGLGRRVAAIVLVALALGGALAHDRLALRFAATNVTSSLTIPGVRVDASRVSSAAIADALAAKAQSAGTRRIRTETIARNGSFYVTVLRSGGVDGAYALMTMLLLLGSATTASRLSRQTPITT